MAEDRSFTGRTRQRKTSRRVRLADKTSKLLITTGGIGTIIAVVGICLFLVYVVVPLFAPAEVQPVGSFSTSARDGGTQTMHTAMDEYGLLAWTLTEDGAIHLHRVQDWQELSRQRPFGDAVPTAWAVDAIQDDAVFGFEDGSIRLARIGFRPSFLPDEDLPPPLVDLAVGDTMLWDGGVVTKTPEGQLRQQQLVVEVDEPVRRESASALRAIDLTVTSSGPIIGALGDDGILTVYRIRKRKNLMTGKVTIRLTPSRLPAALEPGDLPDRILLSSLGAGLYAAWLDGRVQRFYVDAADGIWKHAESLDLAGADRTMTSLRFLLGRTSLCVGDSAGGLGVWFLARPDADEDAASLATLPGDGFRLVKAHTLLEAGSPVTTLRHSQRSRLLASGHEDGRVRVFFVTNENLLAEVQASAGPITSLAIAPRDDALLIAAPGTIETWGMDPGHPDVNLTSLFSPIWYEGSSGPAHVWQSTGATNEFEPKIGVMPLIFGTLKATLYSLLFGVPIALLAALFTSEFLPPRVKVPIKSTIEVMASLPSVVLGFLAALVIAPFVQDVVPSVLVSFLTIPVMLLVGAYVWQLLPRALVLQLGPVARIAAIALSLVLAVLIAGLLGPVVETLLFAGDMQGWLDGQIGSALGGWMMLLIPLASLLMTFAMGRWGRPWISRRSTGWDQTQSALADLARFGVGAGLVLLTALGLSAVLSGLGFDPRGGVVDTYVQRNALVVGFVMGFAIIPIIYTLAEDALSSVPSHLREGSLGAGATPWQTATRIIVPTAMSGLFSAIMIGLGRAVGETMIVLMAAGNTPVLDMNVFNGFRTLSANIAVELPEAGVGDSHYRTLFLTALLLFAMTFVVNTVAEAVRQRFRKRAYQL